MSAKPAVLLVDDEPDMLSSLVGLLRREFEVHTAESGEQALEIIAANEIDILMTDQRMPGMTGSSLLQKVCEQDRVPVLILFTGYADIKSVVDAVNTGQLFRYVTKPWDPDDLTELLHAAATERRQRVVADRLDAEASQCAALGRDLVDQLRGAGDVAPITLERFVGSCDRLAELCTSPDRDKTGE